MNRKERRHNWKFMNLNRNVRKDKNGDEIHGAFGQPKHRINWKEFMKMFNGGGNESK